MLVLSRKIGETIVIGDNIRITVVESKGEQVRIGIDAPRSVSVHRLEVYEEITRENKNAAVSMTSLNTIANIFKTVPKDKK